MSKRTMRIRKGSYRSSSIQISAGLIALLFVVAQLLPCSQAVFAMMLNISPKTVQAWEQGSREPGDAALKLLTIAKKHPEVLLEV